MSPEDQKVIDAIQPELFAVTPRNGRFYAQVPAYTQHSYLNRINTTISTYQLQNPLSVVAIRLTPNEVMRSRGMTETQIKQAEKDKKVPRPDQCPVIRYELICVQNDSAALARSDSDVSYYVLAATKTLMQILEQQDLLEQALDDSKKLAALFQQPEDAGADAAQDAPEPEPQPEATQNQSASTSLLEMSAEARKNLLQQVKAAESNTNASQDPLMSFNPLDLLTSGIKKNAG